MESEGGRAVKGQGPPGLVLTCVNVRSFVRNALECVYRLGAYKVSKIK